MLARWLLLGWVVFVYAAYFRQFDFYVAYALGLIRRMTSLVALQL